MRYLAPIENALQSAPLLKPMPLAGKPVESQPNATQDNDIRTVSGVPVVQLQTETVTDAVAARMAISLLGHVLFLKNQIPLPVPQLTRIPSKSSTSKGAKQRAELLSSFDTLTSHLTTTFTALSIALAKTYSKEKLEQLTAESGHHLDRATFLAVDRFEAKLWGLKQGSGENGDGPAEEEAEDDDEGSDCSTDDEGEDDDEAEANDDDDDSDAEGPEASDSEDDSDDEDKLDSTSEPDCQQGPLTAVPLPLQDSTLLTRLRASMSPPPSLSYAEEQRFLQNSERLLSRVLATADAEGSKSPVALAIEAAFDAVKDPPWYTGDPFNQDEDNDTGRATPLSIKEAIALKRAETKKTQERAAKGSLDSMGTLEDALPANTQPAEEDADLLGRLPLRETIEKARSTGSLNIATRSLPCLPSALFEIHLSITPDPLKSVENEPKLPPAEEQPVGRRGGRRDAAPAWFEAQDLTVLKAWNNEITEIQHEISFFGSLKTVDLHKNKLTSLPNTFADLSFLTVLDLSHNQLTSLPDNLWSMPELTTLNLAHNQLTSLPFTAPFQSASKRTGPNSYASTDFFTPAVVRAAQPLPKLANLDASHNLITSVDLTIPSSLVKFDLSENPLGQIDKLLQKLAALSRLRELRFEKARIDDGSIPASVFSSRSNPPFPVLRVLDFSKTAITLPAVQAAFKSLKQRLDHDFTNDEPPEGVTKILVGKRVIKEAWEIELEKRTQKRAAKGTGFGSDDWDSEPSKTSARTPPPAPQTKSPPSSASPTTRSPPTRPRGHQSVVSKKEVVKEAWEIEAEQGLLTEGGKRRARAAAQAEPEAAPSTTARETSPSSGTTGGGSLISSPQYYSANTQTLTLPPSAPSPKAAGGHHNRSFSLASPFPSSSSLASSLGNAPSTAELALPAPTLPLTVIVAQPFADTLRVLILTNRRLDRSFTIPVPLAEVPAEGFLPNLEELDLEGCNLDDSVPVSGSVQRTTEPLLPTLAKLFPSLRTLNLSYNKISDRSLTFDALSSLILQSAPYKSGLRHFRLRGNGISDLGASGFQNLAEMFKGNRDVPEWKMEELDVRDNEVGRLPPELGLLPLDVLLVEANRYLLTL
ncbi:hypothetical protein EST38_g3239 [Candolleomyces aberdarensis]|uniref:Uncharacterized protein n=1 Tax=Candolleomyces aberdarensis TaxID=2316362 RepID=A0A4Q2DSP7_9AGAR|nr:hypothetical protein EST38_g3239 [Candolleomyces aberdarensis]